MSKIRLPIVEYIERQGSSRSQTILSKPSRAAQLCTHSLAIMSGRGKGGKGLGKGGAKRHRKVLRDNIQGAIAQIA